MTTTPNDLNLSPKQWAAMRHRLEEPSALCDVWLDWNDSPAEHYDAESERIERICNALIRENIASAMDYGAEAVRFVIRDCVEGSTWAASNETAAKEAAARRVVYGLAAKVEAWLGEPLDLSCV